MTGRVLTCRAGAFNLEHQPFRWADGQWETQVVITAAKPDSMPVPRLVILRIAPETLRQWKDIGLDPLREACAQLADHLSRTSAERDSKLLTLL